MRHSFAAYIPACFVLAVIALLAACELSPDRGPMPGPFGNEFSAGQDYKGK